ncbi:MAG: GGDEF domain-containing protein [Treponema sp.]|nr:GGDEF domain-containing protein [Treponema sp.]
MILYIGLSIIVINYAASWMVNKNYSAIASKAEDIAILTTKNFALTDAEVEELKKLEFKELLQHPANIRLADMFDFEYGHNDIRFVYIMTVLDEKEIKYQVTEEYKNFYGTQTGTPLNVIWLVSVVTGKTIEETLNEDKTFYDDIRRYSYLRATDLTAFHEKVPTNELSDDEYGYVITGLAPIYTEEGTFVGMLGVDIFIDEYEKNASFVRLLLLLVFLLPSIILTTVYILFYFTNLKQALLTAQTDPLTSTKNRRFMEKYMSQTVKEHYQKKQPLSVIMIDIDYFKGYNDNYGHQQGDKVLVAVTKAIASILRNHTDVICRYGGEEFLVILNNTNVPGAEIVANRIKTAVDTLAIKHEHSQVSDIVTISQGVYSAVPASANCEKLYIENADKSMYKAKNTGRNKYVVAETEEQSQGQ